MPGLIGLISNENDERLFNRMVEKLNHLNYSIEKHFQDGVHLARLHLGYVNCNPQPIFSTNGRYLLMMIGEIFSYKDIEADQIDNDAEFFLTKWQAVGFDCLPEINGHFAVAIYDFLEKKLILISDRFGTRPVYYTNYDTKFLFGPEVKSLIMGDFKKEIDYESVSDLFHFGHLFGYKTMFRNVYQLPEASYLIYSEGNIQIRRYWDYPYDEEIYTKRSFTRSEINRYCEEMENSMQTAVRRQVTKNKEDILISLSGGLDSRYVAALAHRNNVDPLVAFTMGEPNSEDSIYAQMVSKEISIQHTLFQIKPSDIWRDARYFSGISDAMALISGPIQGFTPLRHYCGSRKVTLSSQMCDAFMGSTLYRKRIRDLTRKSVLDDESEAILLNIFNIYNENKIGSILTDSVYDKIRDRYLSVPQKYLTQKYCPLHIYFLLLMNEHGRRGTLAGNIMNNLYFETRMPSYDYDLIDFAFRIPIELRKNQFLYRLAFARMFPQLAKIPRQNYNLPINAPEIRYSLKSLENRIIGKLKTTSFNSLLKKIERWNRPSYTSYKKWLSCDLRNEVESLLFDSITSSHGMLNLKGMRNLLDEHYYTEQNNSGLIWQTINLEYFLRDNFD